MARREKVRPGEILVQPKLLTQRQLKLALDVGVIADSIQAAMNICRPCHKAM
jgi:hypothetical protein